MTPQPCGTRAAHARHRSHCEDPCADCTTAERDYQRQRYLWAAARAFAARARGGDHINLEDVA